MNKLLTPLATLLVLPLASAAHGETKAADPMAAFYGNTLSIAVPEGYYYARRYIDPDGTWRDARSGGARGVWRVENGQVCSWQMEPAVHNPRHYCYAPVARKVGDRWETTDPDTGNTVIQEIVAGRD